MTPNKLPPLPEHVVTVDSADLSHLIDFMFSRFGSVADVRELPDSLIAPIRRMESALAEYKKAADDLRVYPAAEALRQSQSLPAGAVAGRNDLLLIAAELDNQPIFQTQLERARWYVNLSDRIRAALQADAREKGEACAHNWHDYGQHAGNNLSFCVRCEMLSATGSEGVPYGSPKATQPAQASESLEEWSLRMAAKEEGQVTTAGSFGLDRTHPQPVTPAGGEVDCGCGWGSDCEDAVIDRRLNSLHKDMRANGHNGGMVGVAWDRAVFRAGMESYPPVADAALDDARFEWLGQQMRSCTTYMDGSRAFDAGSFAMRKHNLRGRTIREAIDAAMSEDAALNQRGGGDER